MADQSPPGVDEPGAVKLATIGLAGGLMSGLLGVGGGVIMVPLLVLWARLGQRAAHAASLAAIVPMSLVGLSTYAIAGEIDLAAAAALAVGAVVGARVGAGFLARVPERQLKGLFGLFLIGTSLYTVLH